MNGAATRQRIIVGVDGSDASIGALQQAERMAAVYGADIEAVACWEYSNLYDVYAAMGIERPREEAGRILSETVKKAFQAGKPDNVLAELIEGDARSVLLQRSKGAALLVLGSRGHGGFRGLLVGSVTAACVAHAHCPVLVVHVNDEGLARP